MEAKNQLTSGEASYDEEHRDDGTQNALPPLPPLFLPLLLLPPALEPLFRLFSHGCCCCCSLLNRT